MVTKAQQAFIDEQDLDWADKARLAAQGASFNYSDEALGWLQSKLPEGGTYEDNVAAERAKIASARDKPGSLKYEILGASVPGFLAAPFTGGASVPLTMGRAAAFGGAQALTAGIGAREGDIVDRITESPVALAGETMAGALGGPIASKAMQLAQRGAGVITRPVSAMTRALTGRNPRPIDTEVRRLASSVYPGDAPEEAHRKIVERIRAGDIFPDLGGRAATDTAGYVGTSVPGATAIREVVDERAQRLPREARESLLEDLAPGDSQSNLVRVMRDTTKKLEADESAAYNRIFADVEFPASAELNLAALDLTKIGESNIKALNQLIQARRLPPLFKKNNEGVYELTRNVSLEDGEVLRRGLQDSVDEAFNRSGRGNLGAALKEVEKELRGVLDELSPDLAATRANWSKIKTVKETFDESRKIFGQKAEDAELYIESILAGGDLEKIAALRAGAASGLKAKSTSTSPHTVLRNLDNLERRERIILEKLYPGDSFEAIAEKIARAAQAKKTQNVVFGNSQTAEKTAAQRSQGTAAAELIQEGVTGAVSGNWLSPVIRFVSGVLGKKSKLTQKQLEDVAKIIITEDPNIMEKALNNSGAHKILVKKIQQAGNLLQRGAGSAGAYEAGEVARF
tara:strand:- start:1720 stop:3609 length:1890 start_codon:yes stop_codon:yes gene_type:complete